jgi:hypothetical protein
VTQVPGRKADVSDVEWLAQLLQCGLLRRSFVPPCPMREMRDLTRSRTTLEEQRMAVINRIHKAARGDRGADSRVDSLGNRWLRRALTQAARASTSVILVAGATP